MHTSSSKATACLNVGKGTFHLVDPSASCSPLLDLNASAGLGQAKLAEEYRLLSFSRLDQMTSERPWQIASDASAC